MNDFKNEYKNALESIQPSDDALKSLREKMSEQAKLTALKPKKKHSFFYSNIPLKIATTAACAVLFVGAAIIIPTVISNNKFSDEYSMGLFNTNEAFKCDEDEGSLEDGVPEAAMGGDFPEITSLETEAAATQGPVANDTASKEDKLDQNETNSILFEGGETISSYFNVSIFFVNAYETGANEPFTLNTVQSEKIDEFIIDFLDAPMTLYTGDGFSYQVLYCFNGVSDTQEDSFYIAVDNQDAYFYTNASTDKYKLDVDSDICSIFVDTLLSPDSKKDYSISNDSYDTLHTIQSTIDSAESVEQLMNELYLLGIPQVVSVEIYSSAESRGLGEVPLTTGKMTSGMIIYVIYNNGRSWAELHYSAPF